MCEHERLRTVGDDVFCCVCGEKLPLEFLMNKGKPEKPAKPAEEHGPAEPDEVQTEPAAEPEKSKEKPKKAPAKRTTKTKKDGE